MFLTVSCVRLNQLICRERALHTFFFDYYGSVYHNMPLLPAVLSTYAEAYCLGWGEVSCSTFNYLYINGFKVVYNFYDIKDCYLMTTLWFYWTNNNVQVIKAVFKGISRSDIKWVFSSSVTFNHGHPKWVFSAPYFFACLWVLIFIISLCFSPEVVTFIFVLYPMSELTFYYLNSQNVIFLFLSNVAYWLDTFLSILVLVVALEKVERSSGSLVGTNITSIQKSAAPEVVNDSHTTLWNKISEKELDE